MKVMLEVGFSQTIYKWSFLDHNIYVGWLSRQWGDRLNCSWAPCYWLILYIYHCHACVVGSVSEISGHTFSLAQLVFIELSKWRHSNGSPVCILYHNPGAFSSSETQGPIVNFNLLWPDGSFVGFSQVCMTTILSTNAVYLACVYEHIPLI